MKVKYPLFAMTTLVSLTFLAGFILSSTSVSADDSVVDQINITVPTSCSLSGTGMGSHNATVNNGTFASDIGTTTLKAFCNDTGGFAIYAAGYTGDEVGGTNSTKLVGANNIGNILTGTGTSGNSQWAMKLATDSNATYPITIESDTNGSFASYHIVPEEFVKVATRNSSTDIGTAAIGSVLTTTYQAYISTTQAAGAYQGKVIYTLVHPYNNPIPYSTLLDTGQVVARKMKTLAAGTETAHNAKTSDIKAIRMATELPTGFVASEANTVSDLINSKHPIYIFFDNTNDAGIMYFYSGGYQIVMNSDSSSLFRGNLALTDISGLATWDSSNVTNMSGLFVDSTVSLTNIDALSSWNTSKVENMAGLLMLNPSTTSLGYRSQLTDISALANWDTSSVINMYQVFCNLTSLSNISPLFSWDTSKVTTMEGMFVNSGITNVDPLSEWDVSKVETMTLMFGISRSGYNDNGIRSQLTDITGLSRWNIESVSDMSSIFLHADKITKLDALSGWDVSGVDNMKNMFAGASSLTSLKALEGWDVSNVSDMRDMFRDTTNLSYVSAIEDWDVSGVTATAGDSTENGNNFHNMFKNSGATPGPFTLRAGTWNSEGTYVPSS